MTARKALLSAVSGTALMAGGLAVAAAKNRRRTERPEPVRRSPLPDLALAPQWIPVSSLDEAVSRYPNGELALGLCASGPVSVRLAQYPHVILVGGTGMGTSTIARDWVTQFRAAGWGVYIGDGLGCSWSDHAGAPGVRGIGSGAGNGRGSVIETVRIVDAFLHSRTSALRTGRDTAWPPIVLILDEIDTLLTQWRETLEQDEFDSLISTITRILALGRSARCHMVFVAHPSSGTLPAQWRPHLGTIIGAGPLPHHWVCLFPGEVFEQAREQGTPESRMVRGRCYAFLDNQDGGELVEYQSYYGYPLTPANPVWVLPPAVTETWEEYRASVFDRIPDLYQGDSLD